MLAAPTRLGNAGRGEVARRRRQNVPAASVDRHAQSCASCGGRVGNAALDAAQSVERRKRALREPGAKAKRAILGTRVFRNADPEWGASEPDGAIHREQSSESGFRGGAQGLEMEQRRVAR